MTIPKTYLVGMTAPDTKGITDFLRDTGQEEFLAEFCRAYVAHGSIALCSMYAKMCYRSLVLGKNENVKNNRGIEDNVKGCFQMGHGAVFEHVWLNFVTAGCSRVFTHELVRHRVGTAFSQTSGRYCTPEDAEMVLPPEFETTSYLPSQDERPYGRPDDETQAPTIADAFRRRLEELKQFVDDVRQQLAVDDMPMAERKRWTSALRRIMPSGADNEIGWSVNIRSLRHLIELRTSPHAEWEIRRVFTDVGRIVNSRWPLMLTGGTCETDVDADLDVWTGLRV